MGLCHKPTKKKKSGEEIERWKSNEKVIANAEKQSYLHHRIPFILQTNSSELVEAGASKSGVKEGQIKPSLECG